MSPRVGSEVVGDDVLVLVIGHRGHVRHGPGDLVTRTRVVRYAGARVCDRFATDAGHSLRRQQV